LVKKIEKKILFAVLFLTMLLPMVSNVSFGIVQISDDDPRVFRLLAVEDYFGGYSMKSGQFLINALLGFSNWDNSSTDVSYIHLLSEYGQDEVMDDCKPYWRGYSTKANVEYEIKNFLASAGPNETVIFYICVEGSIATALLLADPLEIIYPEELTSWLSSGGLPQANVCVILDSCASGSWINDGEEPGGYLGPGRVVICSSRSGQASYGSSTNLWTIFTGNGLGYGYGTPKEPGIIGALIGGANDTNQNGWFDVMEVFEFAKTSTEEYTDQKMNPVAYNGLDFDSPFVKLPEQFKANFTVTPEKPVSNQTILFTSTSQGIISEYTWDFGDDNITTTTVSTINHTYAEPGNYTVTLTIRKGISNSTSKTITVYYITDLNQDRTVNIVDISIVASAYGTKEGDDKYNPIADLDGNKQINIIDVSIVALEYGKTT